MSLRESVLRWKLLTCRFETFAEISTDQDSTDETGNERSKTERIKQRERFGER